MVVKKTMWNPPQGPFLGLACSLVESVYGRKADVKGFTRVTDDSKIHNQHNQDSDAYVEWTVLMDLRQRNVQSPNLRTR